MTQEVLTLDEMAEYLRLPKSTAVKLLHDGRVAGQVIGKHWRIAKSAVDAFLTSPSQGNKANTGRKPKASNQAEAQA